MWEASERLAGQPMAAPFWAYAWAGGSALARVVLDTAEWVRGRTVLDIGCGGGIASLAAARAGAARVLANDQDPWALAVTRLAAARQGLSVELVAGDLARRQAWKRISDEASTGADVVLAGDMAYERTVAPRLAGLLRRLAAGGARVLVADAGRLYFDPSGLEEVATFTVDVPQDLEGTRQRTATVYRLPPPGEG